MKNIALILLLGVSIPVWASDICSEYENKIEPDHQWKESEFTKEKASEALKQLDLIVNKNKGYEWYEITYLNTLIEGYILKRSALNEIKADGRAKAPYYGFNQSAFCTWLISTPIVD